MRILLSFEEIQTADRNIYTHNLQEINGVF